MAALSLFTLAVIAGFIWIATSFQSQRAPKVDPPEYSARVESAPSCEALKGLCRNLASSHDVQNAHIAFLNRTTDEIVWRLALVIVGWGVLSSAGFLYIFSNIRRYELEKKVAL